MSPGNHPYLRVVPPLGALETATRYIYTGVQATSAFVQKQNGRGRRPSNERSQESGGRKVGGWGSVGWVGESRGVRRRSWVDDGSPASGGREEESVGENWESDWEKKRRGKGRARKRGRKSQRRQKWESRTLQGIKSLFVTGTVMKILWLVKREKEGEKYLDSPTPRIFGMPINQLIRLPMRARNCLRQEALRTPTFRPLVESYTFPFCFHSCDKAQLLLMQLLDCVFRPKDRSRWRVKSHWVSESVQLLRFWIMHSWRISCLLLRVLTYFV